MLTFLFKVYKGNEMRIIFFQLKYWEQKLEKLCKYAEKLLNCCMFRWLAIFIMGWLPIIGFAQNLDGIWKGYFTTGFGSNKQYYKYETQIVGNGTSGSMKGISYSYLSADFYGKSQVEGSFDHLNKKLELREAKLISFSNNNSSNVCLMHSTLSYYKNGENEILEGVFTSSNSVTGTDCGQGYVYLERSNKSDFHKEPFLAKKTTKSKIKPRQQPKTIILASISPKKIAYTNNKIQSTLLNDSVFNTKPADIASNEKKINTPQPLKESIDSSLVISSTIEHTNTDIETANPIITTFASIPDYFQKRKNKLVKTIITHTPEVDISFYDNGEIDDDSITVYHNLNPIIERGRLSRQPISYGFDASDNNRLQSFIIVADNLGKIPPNSALMVIYTNHQRYEVFIESDLKNNGEVRIVYEPVKDKKEGK